MSIHVLLKLNLPCFLLQGKLDLLSNISLGDIQSSLFLGGNLTLYKPPGFF